MSSSAPSGSTLDRSSDLARKRATIAGAVVGGFLGALLLLVGALCLYRRHARARRLRQRQQMLRQHRSTPSSFLDYDANPFDRATGTESVRTAADAFRGMSHYSSPSAGSLTSMRLPPALALAEDGAAQTPRSWDTFRPSPLRSASASASPTGTSGARSGVDTSPTSVASHAPPSPSIAIPLTTPVEPPAAWGPLRSSLTLWPRGGEPDASFNSSRSSKASSNYSGLPTTSKRPSFGDSVDPFRDSGHIASPGLLPPLEPSQWVAI
ncbi:hypothetical protein WOLCODRAFT_164257 [Wolfiporia cocos MD-104 SS10]|uniref:Uncharacterized protein n=1 Tax=Wolfiporia cocos (strain MD-104) TaxID=742152 RepID=A0A2H3JZ19_WOLCO|nr:hypothetical protein WOLCODRAFT_164257 [Wolfiporia cocos MD-104 SS10]